MQHHINIYNIIPEEQKGCVPGKQGTIDQLMVDKMILNNAKSSKRNLSTAWIDYKKAFDSIPHDWLIKSLEIHKFNDVIVNFFKTLMTKWQTKLTLSSENETVTTDNINIKTGIFQGDCPSGFHFIICLLSWLLKRTKIGYNISGRNTPAIKISHLLFMDDLKLYANNDSNLKILLEVVREYSEDVRMGFGLDKCNKLTIKNGKTVPSDDIILTNNESIKALDNTEVYKYLGMVENNNIKTTEMKQTLRDEYFTRLKKIMKTSLNSKNSIDAINTFATSAITYGFAVRILH